MDVFCAESCLRHDAEHHTPALISGFSLPERLARANGAYDGFCASSPSRRYQPGTGGNLLTCKAPLGSGSAGLLGDNRWWDRRSYHQEVLC